jgi:hypothetical protein
MSDNPLDEIHKKKIENWRYKYDILLRLRDHEHTVLWQKFNVFLLFNSIMITILSAVLILFKGEITLVQNAYFSSINIGENALQSSLPPVLLSFIIWCVSLVAYLCSLFSFWILKGSNFWIDFYEGKLHKYEKETTEDCNFESLIFGDHPTSIRKQIDEIGGTEELRQKYKEHIKKGYVSTRKNMGYLIKTMLCVWMIVFAFSGTVWISQLLNIGITSSLIGFILRSVVIAGILLLIMIGIFKLIDWHDKKGNEKYYKNSAKETKNDDN